MNESQHRSHFLSTRESTHHPCVFHCHLLFFCMTRPCSFVLPFLALINWVSRGLADGASGDSCIWLMFLSLLLINFPFSLSLWSAGPLDPWFKVTACEHNELNKYHLLFSQQVHHHPLNKNIAKLSTSLINWIKLIHTVFKLEFGLINWSRQVHYKANYKHIKYQAHLVNLKEWFQLSTSN